MNAVKFVDGSDSVVEGLAVPYGGPDLHGESFGPETDLALNYFPDEGRPTLYHHGLDSAVGPLLVGRQVEREERPEGQWVRVELDKRSKFYPEIKQLVDDGALSFSSGAIPHLVRTREDGVILAWPWVEISLTPTPANPAAAVSAVKSADATEDVWPFVDREAREWWAKAFITDFAKRVEASGIFAAAGPPAPTKPAPTAQVKHVVRDERGRISSVIEFAQPVQFTTPAEPD